MNYRKAILFLCLIFLVGSASAVPLNTSSIIARSVFQTITIDSGWATTYDLDLVSGGYFAGGFGGFGGGGAGGRMDGVDSGTVNDYSGRVIAQQIITSNAENSALLFVFYRADGTAISGTIRCVPDSDLAAGGTRTVHINEFGGSTVTDRYWRVPGLGAGYTVNIASLNALAVVDPATKQEYFVISTGLGGNAGTQTKWDNSTTCSVPISNTLRNPFVKVHFQQYNKQFYIQTYAVKLSDYQTAYNDAINAPSSDNPLSFLGWLLSPLQNTIEQLNKFAKMAQGLFNGTWLIATLIFSGTIIIGFSALYTALAIVLAIGDTSDLFVAWGKFYRMEMKLFRFYMEIFNSLKNIIKWW